MTLPVYYVGTPAEVEHHARPLRERFEVRIVDAEEVQRVARPGDVCIFFNEFFSRFRTAIDVLRQRKCATLYAIDGILEWRNMWEFPEGDACQWTARPVLCHKVACIGQSQARIFQSWGHDDQCEVVGVPRFDGLLGRSPRARRVEPFTILVLTAKNPGFNAEQRQCAVESLVDLNAWLKQHSTINGTPVTSVWRITQGLEAEVGVDNALKDTTGGDLAQTLANVDAVVTTPSTAMLEAMNQGLPVALLDYNNCPHYVPAAWRITAAPHFERVIPELVSPPPAKMQYQSYLLHDALECQTPALPRLATLIERMHEIAQDAVRRDVPLVFPPRVLGYGPPAAHADPLDYPRLFPTNPAFGEYDLRRLQSEIGYWRAYAARKSLKQRLSRLRKKAGRAMAELVSKKGDAGERRRAS